jgi:hypothetical protein
MKGDYSLKGGGEMLEKKRWNISDSLQSIGITLVVLGIIFSESRVIGYSFIGVGVLLGIISLIIRKIGRK